MVRGVARISEKGCKRRDFGNHAHQLSHLQDRSNVAVVRKSLLVGQVKTTKHQHKEIMQVNPRE